MNKEQTWHDFLATRYISAFAQPTKVLPDLKDEPFIGMWRDRLDMADSHTWVRQLRTSEWR